MSMLRTVTGEGAPGSRVTGGPHRRLDQRKMTKWRGEAEALCSVHSGRLARGREGQDLLGQRCSHGPDKA